MILGPAIALAVYIRALQQGWWRSQIGIGGPVLITVAGVVSGIRLADALQLRSWFARAVVGPTSAAIGVVCGWLLWRVFTTAFREERGRVAVSAALLWTTLLVAASVAIGVSVRSLVSA